MPKSKALSGSWKQIATTGISRSKALLWAAGFNPERDLWRASPYFRRMKLHILAILTHPDDAELGCGGTLIKHARMGQQVGILDLTQGELGTRGTPQTRLQEAAAAGVVMGLAVRENAGIRDGFFRNDEDHQRQLMVYLRRWQPDIVITNAPEDRHPDHGRGAALVSDACFLSGLAKVETSYEGKAQNPWRPKRVFHIIQDRQLTPDFIVDISDTQAAKMNAICAYRSQFHDPESGEPITYIATAAFLEQIESRDRLLGKRIGTAAGEGFISKNIPGIGSLDALILPEIA
jgi:bacillithiol biosynthesis deacetylase BshB1